MMPFLSSENAKRQKKLTLRVAVRWNWFYYILCSLINSKIVANEFLLFRFTCTPKKRRGEGQTLAIGKRILVFLSHFFGVKKENKT